MKRLLLASLTVALCMGMTVGCAKEDSPKTDDPAQMTQPVKPDSKFPGEPPVLTVGGGNTVVYAWRGTYSWDVKNVLSGTGTGVQSDSPHPLDCTENIPVLTVADGEKITLTFDAASPEIRVRRYKSGTKDYDQYDEVDVSGSSFEAKQGDYVYEVIATWEDSLLRSYSGTVYYAFRTAK